MISLNRLLTIWYIRGVRSSVGGSALTFSGKTNYLRMFLIVAASPICYFFWSRSRGTLLITWGQSLILCFGWEWLCFAFCGLRLPCFWAAVLYIDYDLYFAWDVELAFSVFVAWGASSGNSASVETAESIWAGFLLPACVVELLGGFGVYGGLYVGGHVLILLSFNSYNDLLIICKSEYKWWQQL